MRGKLNGRRGALIVIGALALAAVVVSPAIGLRGALTPLQAKKFFLKKKAAERIYLSKAAAESRFLSKAEADARFAPKGESYSRSESDALYLRPEGTIEVTTGPSNWVLGPDFLGPLPTVTHFADVTQLQSTGEGVTFAQVAPTLPTVLYGRETRVVAAELCYDASSEAELQFATMQLVEHSTEVGAEPPVEEIAIDSTKRTDNTCRTYRPPSPVAIGRDKVLSLVVAINYTKAGAKFMIGRTSFVLLP
jgi:hypothetical protein